MRSVFTLTAEDFLDAIIDTRYDLRVVGITDALAPAVRNKLVQLYGNAPVITDEVTVPGNDSLFKDRYSDGDLAHVMNRLTAEDGCPWDRAQTHESIRINGVEEAYELCEAIDCKDLPNIREEVGDLMLQAVFHSDIAERAGEFTRLDVIDELVRKLVTRHTHIFGDDKATNPDEALSAWENAKAVEKKAESLDSQLSRIPEIFPALLRAQKIIKKLVKNGLVNDAEALDGKAFLHAVCGGIKGGLDLEVDLITQLNKLVADYKSGKTKSIKGN